MQTYPVELFMKLAEVFPESLNTSRVVEDFEDKPGPWGMERVSKGFVTENLGADILNTAKAISRGGAYMDDGLRYLETFRKPSVQKSEIKNFLKK